MKGVIKMAYKRNPPIRVLLGQVTYDLLIKALNENIRDFDGISSETAEHLLLNIEKYGRQETNENGEVVYSLRFFEREGEYFIYQFLAAATIISHYEKLSTANDELLAEYKKLVQELNDELDEITGYGEYIEDLSGDASDYE